MGKALNKLTTLMLCLIMVIPVLSFTLSANAEECVHVAGEWTTAKYPTCSSIGYELLKCKLCGKQMEYRTTPTLPHTEGEWETVQEPVCGTDGKRIRKCTVCNAETEAESIDAPEHIPGEWETVKIARCFTEGLRALKCTNCGENIEEEIIPKEPHIPGKDWFNKSAPTCTQEGEKYRKCGICKEIAETQTIPVLPHTLGEWMTSTSSTCNGAGERIRKCTVCDNVIFREIINPNGHTPEAEWTESAPATCTEKGEYHKKCSVCGLVADTMTTPALGHDYEPEWATVTEATCTEDGIKTLSCTRCDHYESEVINAKGHNPGDWTVTEAPDCLNSGKKIITCTVCSTTLESSLIPANGHTESEWEITERSNCLKEGKMIKQCTFCREILHTQIIPISSHEKGNWVITKAPSNESYGIKAKFCIGCGMKMEEKIINSYTAAVVKDDTTGIEIVYPEETFEGETEVLARTLSPEEIGSRIYDEFGECYYIGYEVILINNGQQATPANSYSVKLPVPDDVSHKSIEVYGIDMNNGNLRKISPKFSNGYFVIEEADAIQYIMIEKILRISLSETNLTLKKGETAQLVADTNKSNVIFASSNPAVAEVDNNGNVTAIGAGTAVITATIEGSSLSAECTVEVTQSFFDSIISAIRVFFRMIAELFGL